jgi:hypothetical protein
MPFISVSSGIVICRSTSSASDLDWLLRELARLDLHVHERKVLVVVEHRSGRHDQCLVLAVVLDRHVQKQILLQEAVTVLRHDAHRRGARGGVDHVADVRDRAVKDNRE